MIDNGEVVLTEQDTANVLNTLFSKIPEHADYYAVANNISDPILKVIEIYRSYPSVLTIGEICKKSHQFSFSFSQVGRKIYIRGVQRVDIKKSAQESDISSGIIKHNSVSIL